MFIYDKTKTYTATKDMKDIENFVGFCLPMMIQRLNLHSKGLSEDEAIQKVSTWLYTGCVFENHWRDEGADDVRNYYCREKVTLLSSNN